MVSTIPPSPLNSITTCSLPSFAPSTKLNCVNSFTDSALFVLRTVYFESSKPTARSRGCRISSKKATESPVPDNVEISTCTSFADCRYAGRPWNWNLLRNPCGRIIAFVVRSLNGQFVFSSCFPSLFSSAFSGCRLKMVYSAVPPRVLITVITSSSRISVESHFSVPSAYVKSEGASSSGFAQAASSQVMARASVLCAGRRSSSAIMWRQ